MFTEGTLQQLSPDNAAYARALIDGSDLNSWHSQSAWRDKVDATKKAPTTAFNARRRAVQRMVMMAAGTAATARGQEVTRKTKVKDLRMTELELEKYVDDLIVAQEGLCAITGLALQYELLCSLDRIDSAGHYEHGNLQVVCKLVNRWKNAEDDAQFRRLIALVRASQ